MGPHIGALVADDSSYKQALARRVEIRAELQALQNELRALDDFVTLYERLFPDKVEPTQVRPLPEDGRKRRLRERNIIAPAQLAQIAREILIERGTPLSRSEIAREIEARGIPLVGGDKSKNVGTILWRHRNEFLNIPGRGYWPKGVPLKEP